VPSVVDGKNWLLLLSRLEECRAVKSSVCKQIFGVERMHKNATLVKSR